MESSESETNNRIVPSTGQSSDSTTPHLFHEQKSLSYFIKHFPNGYSLYKYEAMYDMAYGQRGNVWRNGQSWLFNCYDLQLVIVSDGFHTQLARKYILTFVLVKILHYARSHHLLMVFFHYRAVGKSTV